MSEISGAYKKRDYSNAIKGRKSTEVQSLVRHYEGIVSRKKCDNFHNKISDWSDKPVTYNMSNVKARVSNLKEKIENEVPYTSKIINTYNRPLKIIDTMQERKSKPFLVKITNKKNAESNLVLNKNTLLFDKADNCRLTDWSSGDALLHLKTTSKSKDDTNQENRSRSRFSVEFDKIENKLKEAEKMIMDMKKNYIPNYTSNIYHVFAKDKTENQAEEVLHDLNCVENVDVVVNQHGDLNEDFGEVSKEELINADFIEAYNHKGYELLITSVNCVGERNPSNESIDLCDGNELTNDCNSTDDELILTNQPHPTTQRNCIDNKLYFTVEELNELIPDEDDICEGLLKDDACSIIDSAAIKSETIYDSFRNPRIAKVTSISARNEFVEQTCPSKDKPYKRNSTKPKIEYIIEEMIETEKKYINHLECILVDYFSYLRSKRIMQKCIEIRDTQISIKNIYKSTKVFYRALQHCKNYEDIGKTFIEFKPLFKMYPEYCRNKPIVDKYILNDYKEIIIHRQKELNDLLGLASHLLTPIQRLGKYTLFLEQIEKELQKENKTCIYITFAIGLVRRQMVTGDLYIAVDSIKSCPINLLEYGNLLCKDSFTVLKPKKYETVLFLFEKILVFTTAEPKNLNSFTYKNNILLDEMGISTCDYEPLLFVLKRFSSNAYDEYTIEAKTNKDKKSWTNQIEKLLWNQLVECREKQKNLKHITERTNITFRNQKTQNDTTSSNGYSRPKSKFYLNDT